MLSTRGQPDVNLHRLTVEERGEERVLEVVVLVRERAEEQRARCG